MPQRVRCAGWLPGGLSLTVEGGGLSAAPCLRQPGVMDSKEGWRTAWGGRGGRCGSVVTLRQAR